MVAVINLRIIDLFLKFTCTIFAKYPCEIKYLKYINQIYLFGSFLLLRIWSCCISFVHILCAKYANKIAVNFYIFLRNDSDFLKLIWSCQTVTGKPEIKSLLLWSELWNHIDQRVIRRFLRIFFYKNNVNRFWSVGRISWINYHETIGQKKIL